MPDLGSTTSDALPRGRSQRSATLVAVSSGVTTGLGDARHARDGDEWVRAIADDGPLGAAAQRDLRLVLVGGLQRILSSRGVGDDLCEEFAQEALVRIRRHLVSFRGESRFTTWALSIATRVAFDELRHMRWKDISFEAVTADARGPLTFEHCADVSQEEGLVREHISQLRDVIENKITSRQRAVLTAELNGMPHAEIATALGMNRNAVYKLSHDARKRVKLHLEAAGVSEADVLRTFA